MDRLQREGSPIITPDRRLRVFVSSTLGELADERRAAQRAIIAMRLSPIMFEQGARPHPARNVYRAYLDQSDVFIGIYWESYGWVAPGMEISGLEDEYVLSRGMPRLIYVKRPAGTIEQRLATLLRTIGKDSSYKRFSSPEELGKLLQDDLATFLTERFYAATSGRSTPPGAFKGTRLPSPSTRLIGRTQELCTVHGLLADRDVRLVTLVGPGGIGKTRLAQEASHESDEAFEDGVAFSDLAGSTDTGSVVSAMAKAIGIEGTGALPTLDDIAQAIGQRQLLLVLDNFEQVVESAAVVTELLTRCPRLKALATSRAPLRIRAEHLFPVPPLGWQASEAEGSNADAVSLFADRAAATEPTFALTSDNRDLVVEICRRLDGIPLAIELAASRIQLFPPQSVLDQLDSRMNFLSKGPRDAPERQRTLRNTLDWSYELLEDPEKRVFTELGAFVGSFSLEAVEQISGLSRSDAFQILASLIEHSLLYPLSGIAGENRFTLMETVREYACERLKEASVIADIRERHVAFYLRRALAAEEALRSGDQLLELQRLDNDHHDLGRAIEHSLLKGEGEAVADVATSIWPFWWMRGHLDQGWTWTKAVLDLSEESMTPVARARAMTVAATMALWKADEESALPLATRAMALFEAADDRQGVGLALLPIGLASTTIDGLDRGIEGVQRSVALLREGPSAWNKVIALLSLCRLLDAAGRYREADSLYDEALESSRNLGAELTVALCLASMGRHRLYQGDSRTAEELLAEALPLLGAAGDRVNAAYGLLWLGVATSRMGAWARSTRLIGAADLMRAMIGAATWSREQSLYESCVAKLRQEMGVKEYDKALAEGRAMDLAAAVTYAASSST